MYCEECKYNDVVKWIKQQEEEQRRQRRQEVFNMLNR